MILGFRRWTRRPMSVGYRASTLLDFPRRPRGAESYLCISADAAVVAASDLARRKDHAGKLIVVLCPTAPSAT
jgi:hypothetical protein